MKITLIPAYITMDYYDLESNRTYVRGDESTNKVCVKLMRYPGLLSNIFTISEKGTIYSIMNDSYIKWKYISNIPFVYLPLRDETTFVSTPVNIIDIMAYNFIRDSERYIERGYIPIVLDRNADNMLYSNIVYGLPSEI